MIVLQKFMRHMQFFVIFLTLRTICLILIHCHTTEVAISWKSYTVTHYNVVALLAHQCLKSVKMLFPWEELISQVLVHLCKFPLQVQVVSVQLPSHLYVIQQCQDDRSIYLPENHENMSCFLIKIICMWKLPGLIYS